MGELMEGHLRDEIASLYRQRKALRAEVEQVRKERDTALALPSAADVLQWIHTHDHPSIAYPTDHTYKVIVGATLGAVHAIRQARATPETGGPDEA